jgi:hypothetical protein
MLAYYIQPKPPSYFVSLCHFLSSVLYQVVCYSDVLQFPIHIELNY